MFSAAGGWGLATTTRQKTAWKKFKELLPVLSSRLLFFKTRRCVYSSCVGNGMLHASEIWPLTRPDLQRLRSNDRAMIRQFCNMKPENVATVRSNVLLARLEIDDLDVILREKRLRWFGHVERFSGAIKAVCDMQVEGKRGPERPKMTWRTLTERGHREWKLNVVDPWEIQCEI